MDRHTRKLLRQAEREKQRSDPAHQEMRQEQKQKRWAIAKQYLTMGLRFVLMLFGNKITNKIPALGSLKNESNIYLTQKQDENMKSAFGKINGKDLGKGLLLAVLVVVVGGTQSAIADGALPTVEELSMIGTSALTAAVAYLVKNIFTNSQDEFLKTDK